MKYVYPAIFTKEEDGYIVEFPDVEGCFTDGSTLNEALEMAQDALNLILMTREDEGLPIGEASDIRSIAANEDQIVSLVAADTTEYRKLYGKQSVKKTLSIPAWLNTIAEKNNVNFSSVLQNALMEALDLA